MMDDDQVNANERTPLGRLRDQLLQRWRHFPDQWREPLDRELEDGLARAAAAEPESITVMNPVSRPVRLRLAVLVADGGLDTMYSQEWAELAVSEEGRCYLVYRRRNGEDYAIEWSPTTTVPATMMSRLTEPLAAALLDGDVDAGA